MQRVTSPVNQFSQRLGKQMYVLRDHIRQQNKTSASRTVLPGTLVPKWWSSRATVWGTGTDSSEGGRGEEMDRCFLLESSIDVGEEAPGFFTA
jgi:hypothetical protein